jgi:hypothetical protein
VSLHAAAPCSCAASSCDKGAQLDHALSLLHADLLYDTSVYDYTPPVVEVYNGVPMPPGAVETLVADQSRVVYTGLPQDAQCVSFLCRPPRGGCLPPAPLLAQCTPLCSMTVSKLGAVTLRC